MPVNRSSHSLELAQAAASADPEDKRRAHTNPGDKANQIRTPLVAHNLQCGALPDPLKRGTTDRI